MIENIFQSFLQNNISISSDVQEIQFLLSRLYLLKQYCREQYHFLYLLGAEF